MAKTKADAASVRPENALLPPEERKNISKLEYLSLILSRVGGMFGTTLTGTLAATFLYELYFADFPEVDTAQIAGIMAAKHTPDWIPMCHPVPLNGIDLKLWLDEARLSVEIEATAKCDGKTGVEMEALTAVSGAALTVYDMCKAVQRDMVIADIRLLSKTGGAHGDYCRKDD